MRGVLINAATEFSRDKCTLRAAALSYATIFALPPLLIVLIKLAGLVSSPADVQRAIETEFAGLIGGDGARAVHDMVTNASHRAPGWFSTVYGIAGLVLGATGEFLSLQGALNAVWRVAPDPKQGGVRRFLLKRLLSLAMTMGVAFLLVVSLAVTAAIAAWVHIVGHAGWIIEATNSLVAFAALSVLFAAMFKFLPDAVISWRSVWGGGIATAALFEAGKVVIGLYLGQTNPGNAFGAARAFAVILVWIYYAGLLVLLGAEFTEHYAAARGHPVRPKSGAVRTDAEERLVPDDSSGGSNDGAVMKPKREQEPEDAPIGELFSQLTADATHLIRQEIVLAKIELRDAAHSLASAGANFVLSVILALPGVLALTAAAVIGVGIWFGSYWLSALVVGVVILIVAGLMVARALAALKSVAPRETARTLRGDAAWAKNEAKRVKDRISA